MILAAGLLMSCIAAWRGFDPFYWLVYAVLWLEERVDRLFGASE